jgi:hypothetical protein
MNNKRTNLLSNFEVGSVNAALSRPAHQWIPRMLLRVITQAVGLPFAK